MKILDPQALGRIVESAVGRTDGAVQRSAHRKANEVLKEICVDIINYVGENTKTEPITNDVFVVFARMKNHHMVDMAMEACKEIRPDAGTDELYQMTVNFIYEVAGLKFSDYEVDAA